MPELDDAFIANNEGCGFTFQIDSLLSGGACQVESIACEAEN
jgi:hypothetical protein